MENPKKKIIILTSTIAVILIIAIVLVLKLVSLKKNDKTIPVNSNQETNNTIKTENIIENNEVENEINKNVNEIVSEENEENNEKENVQPSQPVADSEQEVDKETIEEIESNEEKAIRIAKENYGEKNSVYFSYEGIEEGKHKVSVRDSNTTRTIREYYIDLEKETFEILQ